MNKSAPFRMKTSWGSYWVTKMRSPVRASGISFPSPDIFIGNLFGIPFSIITSISFSFSRIFLPSHTLHFPPSPFVYPWPWHFSQLCCTCWYIPGPIWNIFTAKPLPLQSSHLSTFYPPFPLQLSQHLVRVWFIFSIYPLYIFYRVTFNNFWVGWTWGTFAFYGFPWRPKNILRRSSSPPSAYSGFFP